MKKLFSLFFFIICIALCISAYMLTTQSIRLDEAQSIWASTKPVDAILTYISHDVHVPLYAILLHFWMQIFGTSIIAARSLSFLFFLITLPVLYQVAKEAGNKTVAILTVTLFSIGAGIKEQKPQTAASSVTVPNALPQPI